MDPLTPLGSAVFAATHDNTAGLLGPGYDPSCPQASDVIFGDDGPDYEFVQDVAYEVDLPQDDDNDVFHGIAAALGGAPAAP